MSAHVPDKPVTLLRQRMIDDMTARRFGEYTQRDYVRAVKNFAGLPRLFAGQSVRRGPSPLPVVSLEAAYQRVLGGRSLWRSRLLFWPTIIRKPGRGPLHLLRTAKSRSK
jgi:hypothetical protein